MNQLESNKPLTTTGDPSQFRREASTSYWRGAGALALAGLGGYGLARLSTRMMPEHVAGAMMGDASMMGFGFWEAAGRAGTRSGAGYARAIGLGTYASGLPKWRWIDMVMDLTKKVEELSPSRMFRTFGLYEHLMPLATSRGVTMRFSGQQAVEQLQYLRALTGKTLSETEAAMHGLTLAEGKLFLGSVERGEVILEHAHLMMRKYVPKGFAAGRMAEETAHFGRLAATYEQTIGGGEPLLRPVRTGLFEGQKTGRRLAAVEEDVSSFMIAGGQSPWQAIKRYGSASTRLWTQRFFRLMDDPFLGMMEIMGHYDRDAVAISRFDKLRSKLGGYRFGLGGKYTGTTAEMFGRWLLPERMAAHPITGRPFWRPGILAMAIGVPLAYHLGSELLAEYGEGTMAEGGIPGVAAHISEQFMTARARVGEATGLQRFIRWQEEAAPESTRLSTIAAFPLAGMLTGAAIGFAPKLRGLVGAPTEVLARAARTAKLPGFLGRIFRGQYTRTGRGGRIGFAIGAALAVPFVPGAIARAIGGIRTTKELDDIYAGRTEVPVRRSRWWSFGRRLFKGQRPEYFIPHWTVRARTRAAQEALFAGDEEAGPIFRALKQTPLLQDIVDPYYFERLHYEDRPYPITGPSDLGLGLIDPLYKATIGKILKPVRYMHREEWQPGGEPIEWEPRPKLAPVPELGGEAPYDPREPYGITELARQTAEYYSEAIGLIGWMGRLASKRAFGDVSPYEVRPRMQSASEIGSIKRKYWDASLGDPAGVTEAYRRLNPRKNRGQYWNPLQNTMPEWLPGEDYFVNFQMGDPYAKIPRGDIRLPGPGYAAMHPELKHLEPSEYPDYYRFKILADVAPYSKEYKYYSKRVSQLDEERVLNKEQIQSVKDTRSQVRQMKTRKQFYEYKSEEEMADLDMVQRGMASWWETATHLGETPIEQIIFPPLAPMGKLVHQRTALEDYERSQVYGTDLSFWNRPWTNFIRPGIYSFARMMGMEGIPQPIEEQRDTEEYFDKLEYVKNLRLAQAAEDEGDNRAAANFRRKVKETMTGMNPYGNPLYILRAMPKRERDYWKAFTEERDPEKQARILELVPEQLSEAYRASWLRRAAKELESLPGDAIDPVAEGLMQTVREDMMRQGQPVTRDMVDGYARAVDKGKAEPHAYADWYRMQEVGEYFRSHKLPGPKWIGWDPRVDIEDIKMKHVRNEGYDFHDFDLWEDRLYAMTRKPYINEAVSELDMDDFEERPEEVQRQLRQLLGGYGPNFTVVPEMNGGRIRIDVRDNQGPMLEHTISRARF